MDTLLVTALDVFLTLTGKLLVPVISLGRWRASPLGTNEECIHSAAGSLWFVRDERLVVTHTGQLFLGVVFYILLVIALLAYGAR